MAMISNKLTSILKSGISRKISTCYPLSAHWNKDFIPGPYPKTEAERVAAAKKYNLHPHEYEPYPDDGFGFGDYPKLPLKGVATRDPFYPYDMPEHRRNFNEAIHIDIDMIGEDRLDYGLKERYSRRTQLLTFLLVWGGLYGSLYLLNDIRLFQPVTEKQYPWQGKKHYTFEKAE